MPGKHHSKDTKAMALAALQSGDNPPHAAAIAGVPVSTVRNWIKVFEAWDDSELDAFIAAKKRAMGGAWAVVGTDALQFVQELRAAGDAKGMLAAATTAGIASTKLESLGQPKNVNQQPSGTDNPLIVTLHDKAG